MGRPERPLPPEAASTAVGRLAIYLRQGREGARYIRGEELVRGLPYAELARRADCAVSTLQRAASGTRVPTRAVVLAYANGCRLDVDVADRLWHEARCEERSSPARADAVPPKMIQDQAELGVALVDLHERNGAPSHREMERRARRARAGPLSRSGIQRTLARRRVPASEEELVAFLVACQVPEDERLEWVWAWQRARRQRRRELAATRLLLHRLQAEAAGSSSGRISAPRAIGMLQDFGYIPVERYATFTAPWTVRCMSCSAVLRVRLSNLVQDHGGCTCTDTEPPKPSGQAAAGDGAG